MSGQYRAAIVSRRAWLTTVTSRMCLDVLRSARVRREQYVGAWIPEPIHEPTEWPRAGGGAADPADQIALDESVTMAFLVVLETMSPAERVAFILHDVYRYSFAEVAGILGRTPAACRQLASSARARVRRSRAPESPSAEQAEVVRRFTAAFEAADIERSSDSSTRRRPSPPTAEGAWPPGPNRFVAPRPSPPTSPIWWPALPRRVRFRRRVVNGRPGLVGEQDGVVVTVFSFDIAHGRIRHIWASGTRTSSAPGSIAGRDLGNDRDVIPGDVPGSRLMTREHITSRLISWASILEENTRAQAVATSTMPFIYPHLALMPDAHLGLGATVGSVIPTLGAIIPAAVGVDIGCGMIAVRTQWTSEQVRSRGSLADLRVAIEKAVPLSAGGANQRLTTSAAAARVERSRRRPRRPASTRPPTPRKWRLQLGSLGSGNHFIEVTVDETDTVWLFLHSGSRGVGNRIAQRHIKVARDLCERWWIRCPTRTSPTSSRTPTSSGRTSASCGGPRTTRCSTARR